MASSKNGSDSLAYFSPVYTPGRLTTAAYNNGHLNHSSNTNNNNNNNNNSNNTTTTNNNNNNSAGKEMMSALTRTTQQPAQAPPARKNGVFARKMRHSSPERSPSDDDNETVSINISGKRFETYLATLQRFPNSLLGDASKRAHFYNESSREYFFDRHRKAFSGILHYYQSNGLLERPEGVSETIFTQEVMFFELGDINALHYEDQRDSENLQQDFQVPSNPFFQTIWVLFERPKSSLAANILAVASVVIILLSIVVFCVETIPSLNPDRDEGRHMKNTWFLLNSVCNGWFTLEYVLRFIVSPNRLAFIRSTQNIIDLISILPYYMTLAIGGSSGNNYIVVLRVVRVVRVVRIFKLTRHSRGLHVLANTIRASFQELAMLCMFLAIGVILFASAVYFAESNQEGTKFKSIPHAFWWAVVTMTTVGYGDIAPETLFGKLIGTLCAISGVLVIALPVPVIVSNFEHFYKEEQARKAREKEITKKEKLDDKLLPMKQSLRLMTQSSILFTGLDSTQQASINSSTKSHRSISIGSIRRNSSTYKTETSLYPPPHCPNEGFVLSPPC